MEHNLSFPSSSVNHVENYRIALHSCPPGHPNRSLSLYNLATSLQNRFKQRGVISDLDEAIKLRQDALVLRPPGHSDRSTSLNTLANSLADRFEQRGIMSDLDEAIELHRDALLLRPPTRFKQRGIISDLDEAIELLRAAFVLYPPGHSGRSSSLNNLAVSLRARFEKRDMMSDLDEAIELHRTALLLRPTARFEQQGIMADLDEAIELHRAALLLFPSGHSDRSQSLNGLAISLGDRFKQRDIMSDLDEAIELHREALLLRSPGHSDRSLSLYNLATNFQERFKQRGIPSDLDEAFQLFLQLPHLSSATSRTDLSVAKSWVASAEKMKHPSALLAYKTALKFLDQQVALLSSSSHHFDVIREAVSSLATDAFSCGVRHGALTTAVELVEQGRAVFWTHLARFSTPLDELSVSSDIGTALAEEFKWLSFRLRNAFDQSEHQSPQIRQLTMQWDDVVSRIRMFPGFSCFFLPPLFSDLQKAAENDPVHVPLDATQAEVSEFSSEFQSLAEQFGSSDHQFKLVGILRKLWNAIVDPVVQALRESNVRPGSRIWWCPTAEFTLLPLHAAGPYEKKKHDLSHIYISSYTPTLATLIRARKQVSRHASSQHFVAIGQGNPVEGRELKCVAPELAIVAEHLKPVVSSFTSLEDSHATVQGALDALNHNQWLHLACHGMPNRTQPFESSFAMRDGPLMIKDIIRTNWQNPEFAFLSACHTTVGDEESPDESIHLAAAMQFCGFRSVIGSRWSVDDDVARQVVSAFYRNLINSGRLDCTCAAVALHKAVKSLRKKIPLEQQIVFVHIGV
ncbi:hypothetical protein BDR04DRAFT_1155112 [Suillus decipiens]|nr:hypothetical protein BDR04DRAFT_1155112 [Suillus decipiens]